MRLILLFAFIMTSCSTSPPPAIQAETPVNSDQNDLGTRKSGSDWPCFLGPTYNSVSTEKGVPIKWPNEGLKILWETELGIGYPPPVVSQGRLFHVDRIENKIRTSCRNSESGKLLWKHEYATDYEDFYGYEPGPRASPVVSDGLVFIYGPDGVLLALDVIKGTEIWKVNTKADFNFQQSFFGVGSVPVVEGNLLIVPVGGSPKGRVDDFRDVKGNGTGLVAFDKKTGKEKYRITDELASYSSPILATIDDRRWGFYFARGGLVGFEPKSGKVDFQYKWRARSLESVNAATPVVIKDQVVITECYEKGTAVVKVSPGKVTEVWTDAKKDRDDKSLMCHWNTPIHVDGYLYASSGRHEPQAELRCVRLEDGQLMWNEPELSRSSLLMVDGHFLCLTERGVLLLLKINPKKFEEVARWKIPDMKYPTWAAPVLSHGLLYIRGKGRLICCELIPEKK